MSIETGRDPRTALVRDKYFSLHPKPLERWLWQQGLPQAAERVFWLHWEEGMRAGDWCSEVPIKRVARECCVDPSTVTRAYQVLKAKGLIRREDPGRDPHNPFCQATAVTEVRLPRELLVELSRSPNRPTRGQGGAQDSPSQPAGAPQSGVQHNPLVVGAPPSKISPAASEAASRTPRPSRDAQKALWARASDGERAKFYAASRDRLTHMDFDADTRLTPEDRGWILEQLVQLAIAKPDPKPVSQTPQPTRQPTGPRRLSVLELARTRRAVLELVPGSGAQEILRQVIWSVEEGALRSFATPLAINVALKKIREGAWNRPNRMPPNWMPGRAPLTHAAPEQCSAA